MMMYNSNCSKEVLTNKDEKEKEVTIMRKEFNSSRFEIIDSTVLKDNGKEMSFTSKSAMMRYLYDNEVSIADIQRAMNCHYSFVYGVISSSREVRHEVTSSKSDEIRKLVDEGKKVGEIAKLLNSNYSFVFGVVKKYNASKEQA